jgi:hypothetical protein
MARSFLGSLIKGSIKLAKAVARESEKARKRAEKERIVAQRNSERLRLKNEKEKIKAQREAEKLRLKEEKEKERLRKIEEKKASLNNISEVTTKRQ